MKLKVFFLLSLVLHTLILYVFTLKINFIKNKIDDSGYIQIKDFEPPAPKSPDFRPILAKAINDFAPKNNTPLTNKQIDINTNETSDSEASDAVQGGIAGQNPGGGSGGSSGTGSGGGSTNYVPFYMVEELPQALAPIEPVYPEDARRLGIEGRVLMQIYIDDTGLVRNIEITKSPSDSLSEAAKKAVYNTRFKPAKINGGARAVSMQFAIRFRLE